MPSFFSFLRFIVHIFHFFCFHVFFFFSQANFTFGFVENLKTYSETWLRMSEVFKTSGNVLRVSQLQVGEPCEIFLFSNFLLFDLDSISVCAKPPLYLTLDLKRAEKEVKLALAYEPTDLCWETSDMKILKSIVASVSLNNRGNKIMLVLVCSLLIFASKMWN